MLLEERADCLHVIVRGGQQGCPAKHRFVSRHGITVTLQAGSVRNGQQGCPAKPRSVNGHGITWCYYRPESWKVYHRTATSRQHTEPDDRSAALRSGLAHSKVPIHSPDGRAEAGNDLGERGLGRRDRLACQRSQQSGPAHRTARSHAGVLPVCLMLRAHRLLPRLSHVWVHTA